MIKWEPIETAPLGKILCFIPKDEPQIVVCIKSLYTEEKDGFYFLGFEYADESLRDLVPQGVEPSHWMPLPNPPEE